MDVNEALEHAAALRALPGELSQHARRYVALAAEVDRLRAALRDVIAGQWSPTGLQDILGDLNEHAALVSDTHRAELHARLEAAAERIAVLEAALRPFVIEDAETVCDGLEDSFMVPMTYKAGDLRAAAEAMVTDMYCLSCQKTVPPRIERFPGDVKWLCPLCGKTLDADFDDDEDDDWYDADEEEDFDG